MTQLLILALSFIGVAIRLRTRRLTQVEWALLLFVAINIFLVQLQMFVGENGKREVGQTSADLSDEQLTEYAQLYTNKECNLILKEYKKTPVHGTAKTTYELLRIQDI